MGVIIGLLLFFGFIISIPVCVYLDHREYKKDEYGIQKEMDEWLALAKISPKSKVVVTTKTGKLYQTNPFEPDAEICYIFNWELYKYTSYERAKNFIECSIKANRFYYKKEDIFIPLCEIEDFKITEEK